MTYHNDKCRVCVSIMVTRRTKKGVDIPDSNIFLSVNERSAYPPTGCWIIVRKIRLNFVIIIIFLPEER